MKLQFLMLGLEASSALKSEFLFLGHSLTTLPRRSRLRRILGRRALDSMLNMSYISPTRTAEPYETVQCGPTSTPNIGCYQEREDSMAAYMNALAWWITKDKHYAEKSIHYMDAWSSTIQGHNNSNAPLQAAWSAANWVRAGEIMRSSYEHWSKKSIKTFSDMLRHAYIPIIEDGAPQKNGNWELVMIESTIGAAVFLEDAALYEKSLRYPVQGRGGINTTAEIIKFWHNQKTFPISGITQETCRDFAHTSFGISSISHIAETLRIQGMDVWRSTDVGVRVKAALELHTALDSKEKPIPKWLCNGTIPDTMNPMLEPAYNALAFNLGHRMPFTKNVLLSQRPAGISGHPLFIGFETLTNAKTPFKL
ncbi:chondroitin AC/alginate lyase [Fusarium oxysporum]|nr:chondroitin AC/alginate lyase [Fusarium oxysporum]